MDDDRLPAGDDHRATVIDPSPEKAEGEGTFEKHDSLHLSRTEWDFLGTEIHEVEELINYEEGGYHPVHLGDVFEDRYKVIHKLGYGGFSTVWLARDNHVRRYVAVKILCADASADCPDLKVLEYLRQTNNNHPGRQYIAFLLDHFELHGPNGTHLCLVSEVVGPSLTCLIAKDEQLRGSVARKVARQLVEAVAFLHSEGVCHGDLTTGNLALELADLDSRTDDDVYNRIGKPEIEALRRASGKEIPPSIPHYVVKPASIHKAGSELLKENIRIVDFGIAFFVNDPPRELGTPPGFAAPEIWFEKAASRYTDLWALGCAIYTIRSNARMIEVTWGGTPSECIGEMVGILGAPPEKWGRLCFDEEGMPMPREETAQDEDVEPWVEQSISAVPSMPLSMLAANIADEYHGPPRPKDLIPRQKLPTEIAMEARSCYINWPVEKPRVQISSDEAVLIGDLLEKLIRWESEERVAADTLLDHPWFTGAFEDAKTADDASPSFQSG